MTPPKPFGAGARTFAAACVALVLASLASTVPAGAAQEATGAITLLDQTPVARPGEPFTATLGIRTSSPTAALEVAVGTYRRLRSRSEFVNAIGGRLPNRTPNDLVVTALDELPRDETGNAVVTVAPRVSQDGVYPIRIELREVEGDVVDGFTTFLSSVSGQDASDPLDVAVVLPFHAPPATKPDGTIMVDDRRSEALAEMADLLARAPSTELTLVPTPETVEALAASDEAAERDTVAALAGALAERQVLGSTYVITDPAALDIAGLDGELAAQVARGDQVLRTSLGAGASSATRTIDAPLDDRALGVLNEQGVERFVVAEGALTPIRPPNGVTLTATFDLATAAGTVAGRAAVADATLADHLVRDAPPALAAAHLLADLTVLWLDRPGTAPQRRGVVVAPSRTWEPDVDLLDQLIEGLEASPVLDAVTLEQFFAQVGPLTERSRIVNRTFVEATDSTSLPASPIRRARMRVTSVASVVELDNPLVDDLNRRLLVAQSSELTAAERRSYLTGIGATIERQLRSIEMPETRSITLTAREGELPVTITSRLPYPAEVLVSLESDALDFPAGASKRVVLAGQNTTERFEVHARGSGSFPVRVMVTAPDGSLLVAESRFTVRSTAVSGVGVALSIGAIGFIVVWWASHLRTRRSGGKPASSEPLPA